MRFFRMLFDWFRKTDKLKLGDVVRLPWPEDHLTGTIASFGISSDRGPFVRVRLRNQCYVEWGKSECIIVKRHQAEAA